MPAVDIRGPEQAGSKQGFGTGLPTPVLLALVGGGIGLVVFLSRRSGSNTGTGADKGTLLPNTAIMLGSLQQGILELQGKVTMGNADLSSQLTGVGENLGSQIDAQSAQIQGSFADLNTYLGTNFTALAGSEQALSTAIAGLGTQNVGLADSLTSVLNQLYGISGGIQKTQQGIVSISGGVNQILSNQSIQQADLGTLLNWESEIKDRLEKGDYSAPFHGPSYQPWTTVHDVMPPTQLNTTPIAA